MTSRHQIMSAHNQAIEWQVKRTDAANVFDGASAIEATNGRPTN